MTRAPLGDIGYWNTWVEYGDSRIANMLEKIKTPAVNGDYEPQYVFQLAQEHWHEMLCRYSRGDPIQELARYFAPSLDAWEEAERLGKSVWTEQQQHTRHAWAVNFDHYIVCFWLVGLALALDIPDDQWKRLLALIGNEGEDQLLDQIIATRQPGRKIGSRLSFDKPYSRLLAAVDAPAEEQPKKLKVFLDTWYKDLATIGKSGHAKQAVPYAYPYWYKYGDENFEGGAYFGRWCVEAVAAVKAFGLDDSLCLGHEHYPGDLLRPGGPSTHPHRPETQADLLALHASSLPKRSLLSRLFGR